MEGLIPPPIGAFEPDLAGRIATQILPLAVGEQRTQMQRRRRLVNIDMHHHRGVLAVRPAGHLGIPTGLDQPSERLHVARKPTNLPRRLVSTV